MKDSAVFDWVCSRLEESTPLAAIEARGTVRIALEKGGLDAGSLDASQLGVVVERLLPDELRRCGIDNGQVICEGIALKLINQHFDNEATTERPEDVFTRLGG